jgi:HEAT repeat protein
LPKRRPQRALGKPAALPEAPRIARWVAELDDNAFQVRQAAIVELARLGEDVTPWLRKGLESPPSLEARRRMESLLEQMVREAATPAPEKLRSIRALEVLERIGSSEARQVVADLAKGHPDAWLSQEAATTSQRMARRAR